MIKCIIVWCLLTGSAMANDYKQIVIKGLLDRGISFLDTIAIAANISVETGGTFDPATKQGFSKMPDIQWFKPSKAGRGTGLVQWDGSRRFALKRFAESRGTTWRDMATQIDFIIKELLTTHKDALDSMNKAQTLKAKVIAFETKFEKAGKPHMDKRIRAAIQIRKELGNDYGRRK